MSFFFTESKERKHRRLQMHSWLTALVLLILTFGITIFALWLQPNHLTVTLQKFMAFPILIFLNWLPVLFFCAVAFFLCKNVFFGSAIGGGIWLILSYVNLLKTEGREDPLVPSDIFLIREAMNAAEEYQLAMHWDKVICIVLFLFVLVVLGIFIKSSSSNLAVRLTCCALTVLLFTGCVHYVYSDADLYNSFDLENYTNIPNVFNTLGFPYCFLYNYNLYPVDKPDGYNKSEVLAWIEESDTTPSDNAISPNIIFVMGEAFTDLADEDVFLFTEDDNPLQSYHTLAASDRSLSGHIIVSNYGAGTANTEFDILTGMQTNMISDSLTSSFRVVRRTTPSIASLLAEDGYRTFFLHPGQSWFYNRTSVYNHLGISDQVFIEAFSEEDYKGNMISDVAFLEKLEENLQSRMLESEAPLFTYSVSIQNHQSYTYSKYDFSPDPVETTEEISESAQEQLAVYFEGLRDTADMILEFAEYLDTVDEPVMLVFFGDHRPNLGTACTELGLDYNTGDSPEAILDTYKTPYTIWVNQSYADTYNITAQYASLHLSEENTISSNYLGAMVLQLIGRDNESAFYQELNALREVLPVIRTRENVYLLGDGTLTEVLTDAQNESVERLSKWIYYYLKS